MLAPLLIFVIFNGGGVAGQSYGILPRQTQQNTFGYNTGYGFPNFRFSTDARPDFPAIGAPVAPPQPPPQLPPPPPVFTYNSRAQQQQPPPPIKPYCDLLQYLESDNSCKIPNSLHPMKGSCIKHVRCFRYRTGRIKPLEWACAVGEIFSPVSNQCEDARLQATFKEDYCPQIYCDAEDKDKGQSNPNPGTSQNRFVFPIIPDKRPVQDGDPLCPPQDEDLEFGPVQKCKPKPSGGSEGKYGVYFPVKPKAVTPTTGTRYGGPRDQGQDQDNKFFYEPRVPQPGVDPNYGKEPTYRPPAQPPQPNPGINRGEYNPQKIPLPVAPVHKDRNHGYGHGHGHTPPPPPMSTEPYEPPLPEAQPQPTDPHYDDEPLAPEQGASTSHHGRGRGRGRNSASSHLPRGGTGRFTNLILLFMALICCFLC